MIHTSSARNAIAIATANGWTSPDLTVKVQTGGSGSNVSAILHGLDCGRILRAMGKLRGVQRAWIIWAYAADGWSEGLEREAVYRYLLDQYYSRRKVRQHGKTALLAIVAMEDYRRQMRSSKPGMGPEQIGRMVGFRRTDWPNTWKAAWDLMGDILEEIDLAGLGPIGEVLPRSDCERIRSGSPEEFMQWVAAAIPKGVALTHTK